MKKLQALKNSKKGFTLIEVIVVIAIIAILAAIAIPTMGGFISQAKQAQVITDATAVKYAIQADLLKEVTPTVDTLNAWADETDLVTAIVDTEDAVDTAGEVYFTVDANGTKHKLI